MACSGGGRCQSNCYKEEEEAEPEVKKEEKRPQKGKRLTTQIDSTLANLVLDDGVLCSKCKEEKSAFSAQSNNPSSEGGGLCLSCFRSSLFSKFKLAVTSHSMISPTDKVLVAFSGGPASRFSSLSLGVYFFFCFYSLSWFFFFLLLFPIWVSLLLCVINNGENSILFFGLFSIWVWILLCVLVSNGER